MKEFVKTFDIKNGPTYTIRKVSDEIYASFKRCKCLPISNSAYFHFSKKLMKDELFLPKLYSGLNYIAGPSSFNYDDYKGSFSFLFELTVNKNKNTSVYLYNIFHYRSYIDFSLYQIVPDVDPRDERVMHQPNEELFSEKDIASFSLFFCDYALGFVEHGICKPEKFVKCSHSNKIIFGCSGSEYFYKQYHNEEEFENELKLMESE